MKAADIIKRPIALTEKATRLKDANKVIFRVAMDANKIQIRSAIEELFSVKVEDVNTLIMRGKIKRVGRREGKRLNWKKAVVTLRAGDEIKFFEEGAQE